MTTVERGRYCRGCGYPLFGLEGLACPECGFPFDPSRRRTTDPFPGFTKVRRRAIVVVTLLVFVIAGIVIADRYILESGATQWERCVRTGAIRSVSLSRIFGTPLDADMHFQPRGFDHAQAEWVIGVSAAISEEAFLPGSVLILEKDGAFGAFRFDGLERNEEGQLFVIGAFAWRPDHGSLADLSGNVIYGAIGLSPRATREVTFGPFSFVWSESGEDTIFFYYERFFGDARPGDTRMAALRPSDGMRLERIRFEDVAPLLRASRTDGQHDDSRSGDP